MQCDTGLTIGWCALISCRLLAGHSHLRQPHGGSFVTQGLAVQVSRVAFQDNIIDELHSECQAKEDELDKLKERVMVQ